MSTQDEDERREYYRIDDTIALEFTLLDGAEATASEALHDSSPLFNLLSELHLLDYESQHLLRHISERDRTLANYLKVINKRTDLLGQALAQNLLREIGPLRQVSMSEGGLGFDHPQPIALGSHLAMKMVLMPQALGLLVRAVVIHCQPQDNGSYDIGTEFEAMSDAQRQLLARHILQKQALERRQAREQL
ncbi:PilZ domain-containing protein [Pseudomonas cavernae]|uniref:PilZ domain-containing protein n=1 Tax=Pseudomonas cavernae TaxID=2320867 RepID=A0A385Z2W3_9PSED|nr:PilZ domain-containing protein [Pseudomonas cavernae]AYC33426.1 PilZ domain-containing protein [Pseudomonas cavernae]